MKSAPACLALALVACDSSSTTPPNAAPPPPPPPVVVVPPPSEDAGAAPAPTLAQLLEARLVGDRTGACVAAAIVGATTERAVVCADPGRPRALSGDVALEIGSVTKTLTAALIADLAREGKLRLDDPVADHLPAGTVVPSFEGAPIRLAHLVTHTAALPSYPPGLTPADPTDPYAHLTEADLLAALQDFTLPQAPGSAFAYSNFGYMLLSLVGARVSGQEFEAALRTRFFEPLGMTHAFVSAPPTGVTLAPGHRADGQPTPPWSFAVPLAGAGGVRATVGDVIRYAEGQLGRIPGPEGRFPAFFAGTHARVDLGAPPAEPELAMGWVRIPLGSDALIVHDGETGGHASFVGIDRARARAIVLLADTAVGDTRLLADLAGRILDPNAELPGPRLPATPPPALVHALVGAYTLALEDAVDVELTAHEGALVGTVLGEAFEFRYDSWGDFYPLGMPGLLTPTKLPDGTQTFVWTTDGKAVVAERR